MIPDALNDLHLLGVIYIYEMRSVLRNELISV